MTDKYIILQMIIKQTILIWSLAMIIKVYSYSCNSHDAFMRCNGRWNGNEDTLRCWQDYNGNFQSCSPPYSRGVGTDKRYFDYAYTIHYYYDNNLYWCCWPYDKIWYATRCHSDCETCQSGGNQPTDNCLTCASGFYKWTGPNRCRNHCPNQINYGSYSAIRGEYEVPNSQVCALCDSTCAWCMTSSTECYTCVSGYYLLDSISECTTNYGASPSPACPISSKENTCVSTCPTYYFPVEEVDTGDYSWTGGVYKSYRSSNRQYRRLSNVCHPCDKHCQTCDNQTQSDCTYCANGFYQWEQKLQFCENVCPYGGYRNTWVGQYLNPNTPSSDRVCEKCHDNCLVCNQTTTTCYICKDSGALMDLKSQCTTRYLNNATQCTVCGHTCQEDRYCRSGGCPAYFFFELKRNLSLPELFDESQEGQEAATVQATADDLSKMLYPNHPRYLSIINASELLTRGGDHPATIRYYRQFTDFCMLCHTYCVKCTGPLNLNCTQCRNYKYKWVGATVTVCQEICPVGQYKYWDSTDVTVQQTQCNTCMNRCKFCFAKDHNCTLCVGYNSQTVYDFNNANAGYLFVNSSDYRTCLIECPDSTQLSGSVGYYQSIKKMLCYPCPYPCVDCNVEILEDYYSSATTRILCQDDYCSNGIVCTGECLPGFALVAGKCIQENNCRQYSYYAETETSTAFSTSNCQCLDGYSQSEPAKCDIRCYITCKTCTGAGESQCLTCQNGYQLDSGACVDDLAGVINCGSDIWMKKNTSVQDGVQTFTPASTTTQFDCGGFETYWGYLDYGANKTFQHDIVTNSSAYYAIEVKMVLLFVDEFDSQGAIYLSVGSADSPIWSWNFDTKETYGEQRCGDNRMDYVMNVYAQLPKNWTTSTVSIFIQSNEDLIEDHTDKQLHWGIGQAMFTALSCHSSCSTCTGPTQNQCTSCSTTGEVPVDGFCVCNSGTVSNGNYYYEWDDGACHQYCDTSDNTIVFYADMLARKCTRPMVTGYDNCLPPYEFGYKPDGQNYGYCIKECPYDSTNNITYYASMKTMTCLQHCSDEDQYDFNFGATRTCEDVCPDGYIADPSTDTCVTVCPTGYFFSLVDRDTNPMCVDNCTVGYAYKDLQVCVEDCPAGYFKQITDDADLKPQCVKTCVNAYGDSSTGFCVLSCPFPTYADSNNWLCVDTCSDPAQFMQVNISNLNRTCEDECATNQYGNPFTHKCTNYSIQCPDGYFADDSTHMCEAECQVSGYVAENTTKKCQTTCTTGYANWQNRTCVDICPSDPDMYGSAYDSANYSCVSDCDYATTGLFADPQANRTCVQKCSAAPVATFGDTTSSQCVDKCPMTGQFGDPLHAYRQCVEVCTTGTFSYVPTKMCVQKCPDSYYSDATTIAGEGKCVTFCTDPYFAEPVQNQCRAFCRWGYYGLPSGIRPCVITCPYNWFGINMTYTSRKCVQQCDQGYWGDLETSMCYNVKQMCSNDTYADAAKKLCVEATNCTEGTFADPFTKGCETSCSNGYYADDNINTCVKMCSDDPDNFGLWGICRSSCTFATRFADPQVNRTCQRKCSITPLVLYGDLDDYYCVQAKDCPIDYYGSNTTQTCVNPCVDPLPFGDPLSKTCVIDCPDGTYGDETTTLCVEVCDFTTSPPYYADNQTGNCEQLCTEGTFGVNSSVNDHVPSCEYHCPPGSFARDSDRICVDNCGADLYGDPLDRVCYSDPQDCPEGYYANSVDHMCVKPEDCQEDPNTSKHFYAQNSTKTCVAKCDSPNYGDSYLWLCIAVCNTTYFGENTTRECLSGCSTYGSFADSQNRLCVSRCSDQPFQSFADLVNYKCVQPLDCPTASFVTYAQNSSQTCVQYCDATNNEWADATTKKCVFDCPNGYYKDDSTSHNLCSDDCPDGPGATDYRFRDNSTNSCVDVCPESNETFGDVDGDACVYTCPENYYAQVDDDRRCVDTCKVDTWANKISRVCITDPLNQCPPFTWADSYTHICEEVCSASQDFYGDNETRTCETTCPSPSFAYDGTRVCIDICPPSLTDSGLFGDPLTDPRKCYATCQSSGHYRDPEASRTCATSCTYNTTYKSYKDSTTWSCEKVCSTYPEVRYADDNLKSCETSCAGDLKKNEADRTCVQTCSVLYDPTTDSCVEKCPRDSSSGVLYADLDNDICVVASACPTGTWADSDNNVCTDTCPEGTYKSGDYCVHHCPDDYFMDDSTQSCVIPTNCPSDEFADNQTRSCVDKCVGSFGDSDLRRCIFVCYGNKYGDPFTHTCETSCSNGLQINQANNSCVADCEIGLFKNPSNSSCSATCDSPYYADNNTQACVEQCTANPMTFATDTPGERVCVSACADGQMHDLVNRQCVTTCPANTYAYDVNMSCVSFCPGPSHYQLGTQCVTNCSSNSQYADDTTRQCVSSCPTGTYKDPLSYKCVVECPSSPSQYYISESQGKCTTTCPSTYYASNQDLKCVKTCPLSPRMFALQTGSVCVETCPASTNTFADLDSGKCVSTCPSTYFADSLDRTCKKNCSFLFADSKTFPAACVANCTSGTYANELTYTCNTKCPENYYAYSVDKICVKFCPHGYFADPTSTNRKCVVQALCPLDYPYADSLTHFCTDQCSNNQWGYLASGTTRGGACVEYCPDPDFFSNPLTGLCVKQCPTDYFADDTNQTCTQTCPDDKYMDSVNKQCTPLCPADDDLFADLFNRTCVTDCDPTTFTFADSLTRICQKVCTGNQYADKNTNICVAQASCSDTNQFTDPHYKKCVDVCYNGTFGYEGHCFDECPTASDDVYADIEASICVAAEDCPEGTYGNQFTKTCVQFCSIQTSTFADIDSKKCVLDCDPLFADNSTRSCVQVCPEVPILFGDNSTHTCVHKCTYLSFADQTINLCSKKCPDGYFADQSTLSCVKKCPEGKFGNNLTNYCVDTCPITGGYFGDPRTRNCVLYCPDGTYADVDHNRECQPICFINPLTYAENSTKQCRTNCLTGFKNERTKQCIEICTAGYYGHNKICYQTCPTANPLVYADDSTHLCVQDCPDGTYNDKSTKKCVQICPISQNTYADDHTGNCESICQLSGTYADPSTRKCVDQCPSIPALFSEGKVCVSKCLYGAYADNKTRSCAVGCPDGTYADNTTMKCQLVCPTEPLMFGENLTNKCVKNCDVNRNMFADNSTRTCVFHCSEDAFTFADPVSRTCVDTCPLGYFARNDTQVCQKNCPANSFADPLLRICVAKCSVDPIYYGDRASWKCVKKCPASSFGNPLNQECQPNAIGGVSTCPDDYFADETTQLCVQVCPEIEDLYGDPITKHCQSSCSLGYAADNSTMRCVQTCPEYPNYFENQDTHRCVYHCPVDTFADLNGRKCVSTCSDNSYAENFTQRCVTKCQYEPLGYADDNSWTCIEVCPDGTFADNSTLKCVSQCPREEDTYGDTVDNVCVRMCPEGYFADTETRECELGCTGTYYADNSTNKCVETCPKYPEYYSEPIDNTCVLKCPSNYFAFEDNRTCDTVCPDGYYRQNSTRTCVKACDFTELTFADNLTKYCVSRCSVNSWADPTTHVCVKICPDQPMMYADNSSQECMSRCPGSTYGDNETRSCVTTCPPGSLSHPDDNLCVRYCPLNYFAYLKTYFCVSVCPYPLYGDPSTRECVSSCPMSQLLYADNSTRRCVSYCPSGSYADKQSIQCVEFCPDNPSTGKQTYAADYNNACVEECALPYYGYLPTKKCVNNCPDPYYNDVRDHMCYECPQVCKTCSTYTLCTVCISNYYLQNGECVLTCATNYFANSNTMKCVTSPSCSPNFGVNETHTCNSSCPEGSYKNYQVYRCDACPSTCLTCTAWSTCQTCIAQSMFGYNYCHPYCNSTNIYYDATNETCLADCTGGTYLDVLFCKPCNSICTTCSMSASNCTLCANGLYLQNQVCVSSCSSTSRPNSTRHCVYCGTNCDKPLDFSTNITNINGQSTVFVTFTDSVNFADDLQNIFALQPKSRRLLQDQTPRHGARRLLVNYRVQVVDDQTVKLVIEDQGDASDFQLQILQPESITDSSGNIPMKTRDEVVVDLNETYQTPVNTQDVIDFSMFFMIMGIVSVVSFLFDLEFMKYLQLIFIHYFVVMVLPPQLSSSLKALRYSTLNYLPTLYPIPEAILKPTVPGKIYDVCGDFAFLRTGGFILTPLVVLFIITIIMKILTIPEINRFKNVRVWCKEQFDQKFKIAFFIEFTSIFYLNTIFFIFLQMRDYQNYDGFYLASIIISDVILFVLLILIIVISKGVIDFFREHQKLSTNLKKATDLILQQKEYHKLNSANIFLFEMKKIDLRNIFYPKINNQNIFLFRVNYRFNFLALLCLPVTYGRGFLISLIIALGGTTTTMTQMSLCIPVNILCLLYFIKARPYSFKFHKKRIRNYIAIFNEATLVVFELLMLALGILQRDQATALQKEEVGLGIIIYLIVTISINFIYMMFRIGVQIWRRMFIPFSHTQLFRNNFPNAYEKLHGDPKKKPKLLKGIDPRAKQAIRAMVKSYKSKKSALRPNEDDKANPQLPIKYKLKYFDRDSSSVGTRTSMTKTQKRKMMKQIFKSDSSYDEAKEMMDKDFEEVISEQESNETEYEQIEEQIEIKAKDLQKYVKNAEELLRLKRNEDDEDL